MAGIYIHIPFCRSKCAYCDFFSTPATDSADAVTDAIAVEARNRLDELGGEPVTTLYIGGGTPSLLAADRMARLIGSIDTSRCVEITVEANPEDVTDALAAAWGAEGVNRVSIGVQSLVDSELAAVGRRHDAARAVEAIETLHRNGLTNVSGDIIYGLPGQTPKSLRYSLRRLICTGITHLSCYSLMIEQGSRLYAMKTAGRYSEPDDDTAAAMYAEVCAEAARAGFEHYEISNFAIPDMRSRHNSSYWHQVPYLGLGPAAHSCGADGVRRYNPADIKKYLAGVSRQGYAFEVDEETEVDRLNDMIVTALRTCEGLDLRLVPDGFMPELMRSARLFVDSGRLVVHDGVMSIPERYWIVSDSIIRELLVGY